MLGCHTQPTLLPAINGLQGRAACRTTPGLDLDEDHSRVIGGNEIDFSATASVVTGNHRVTEPP